MQYVLDIVLLSSLRGYYLIMKGKKRKDFDDEKNFSNDSLCVVLLFCECTKVKNEAIEREHVDYDRL